MAPTDLSERGAAGCASGAALAECAAMQKLFTRSLPLAGLLVSAGLVAAAGCSSSGTTPGGASSSGGAVIAIDGSPQDGAGGSPDASPNDASTQGDAPRDAPRDAATLDGAVVGGCVIRHEKTGPACGDVCGVHLTLVGPSDWYCTQDCSDATQCGGVAGLTCAPYGACVPTCTADAECTAQGFKRCDTTAGACDTI